MSVLKVAFFLILWFLVGIFILPFFLKKAKRLMNNETLLIVSLGLCLAMVVLATRTGFSAALGAFIMGSILAETVEAEHIEHIIQPVKDLFGAIFFVSVGMLVNPSVLLQYAWPVVIITLVTLVGKSSLLLLSRDWEPRSRCWTRLFPRLSLRYPLSLPLPLPILSSWQIRFPNGFIKYFPLGPVNSWTVTLPARRPSIMIVTGNGY